LGSHSGIDACDRQELLGRLCQTSENRGRQKVDQSWVNGGVVKDALRSKELRSGGNPTKVATRATTRLLSMSRIVPGGSNCIASQSLMKPCLGSAPTRRANFF
jgi:hypothetical protein